MIDSWYREILLVQTASALFMTGLIWFVQLVLYPLMSRVGEAEWRTYERDHQRRTTWIVAPVMLTELVTAALLVVLVAGPAEDRPVHGSSVAIIWICTALLVLTWLSTFAVQVRLHTMLLETDDLTLRRRLVTSNWPRTVAWSARSVLLLWLLR